MTRRSVYTLAPITIAVDVSDLFRPGGVTCETQQARSSPAGAGERMFNYCSSVAERETLAEFQNTSLGLGLIKTVVPGFGR